MNLARLFEMQRELDERIIREKGLEGQDLLPMKILALQVELGELANEWRGFKYWSEDRVPRTRVLIGRTTDDIGFKDIGPEHIKNPLLEEYVDCLHFILSIGLEIGVTNPGVIFDGFHDETIEQFLTVFYLTTMLTDKLDIDSFTFQSRYVTLFEEFIYLGNALGFDWEEVENAYLAKNAVNHQRQEVGY